jgi:hypothetical protein
VLFQVGRVLAEKGDVGRAEAALRAALKGKPKEPAIWQALHGVLDWRRAPQAGAGGAAREDRSGSCRRGGGRSSICPQGSGGGCAETGHGVVAR